MCVLIKQDVDKINRVIAVHACKRSARPAIKIEIDIAFMSVRVWTVKLAY